MTNTPHKPRRTRNPAARAAFFARKDEIAAALQGGAYLREVCERVGFPGSYSQFARYCARYLAEARPNGETAPPPASEVATVKAAPKGQPPASPEGHEPRRAPPKRERPIYDPANIDKSKLY